MMIGFKVLIKTNIELNHHPYKIGEIYYLPGEYGKYGGKISQAEMAACQIHCSQPKYKYDKE